MLLVNCRMKDGIHFGDDSTLVIHQTTLGDTGIYTCRASNDFSAITSPIITVLINGMNNIHFTILK